MTYKNVVFGNNLSFLMPSRIFQALSLWLLACALLITISATYSSNAFAKGNPKYASIVIDAESGTVLSQRYADKILHPASLTKMMTLLLVFEELEKGSLRLYDRINVSRTAANAVPSKLGLKPGSTIRVKDAILALVTKSANDVAIAVAEHLEGSEKAFARKMTEKARYIGMTRTIFRNASGLHNRRQVSTARDIARLSRYLIKRYPQYYKYFSTTRFSYGGKTYRSHNKLMGRYVGMDGLKTGYISASGYNLAASVKRGNKRIIGVVFGGRKAKSRNIHMANILDRGFKSLERLRLATVKAPVPKTKPTQSTPDFTTFASLNSNVQTKTVKHNIAYTAKQKTARKQSPAIYQQGENIIITSMAQKDRFDSIIGQGDYDPALARRIETGLLAIVAHKGRLRTASIPTQKKEARTRQTRKTTKEAQVTRKVSTIKPAAGLNTEIKRHRLKPPVKENWVIQIGAFKSRVRTDEILRQTLGSLPVKYKHARPSIAPLKTPEGYIYRARIYGLTKGEAYKVCRRFEDCLVVGPNQQSSFSSTKL